MWDLAVREKDFQAVDGMLRRFADAPLSYRILPAYARGDSAAIAEVREEARQLDARQSQIAARFVATYLEDPVAAESLARLDLQPRRNPAIRQGAQSFLAWLQLAQGRWGAARATFDTAEAMPDGQGARVERAVAASLPFVPVPPDDLRALRAWLASWNPGAEQVPGAPPLAQALRPHLRSYLQGLLSAKAGELDAALRHAQDLDRLETPAAAQRTASALAATIRADVAMRRGQPREALSLLNVVDGQVPLELVMVKPFVNTREFTQEHARYLRASALLATGQLAEARRWLETSFQGSPHELVYRAPVHLMLARVLRRQDPTAAAAHLQSAAALWRNADAPLRREISAVRDSVQ